MFSDSDMRFAKQMQELEEIQFMASQIANALAKLADQIKASLFDFVVIASYWNPSGRVTYSPTYMFLLVHLVAPFESRAPPGARQGYFVLCRK